MRIFRVWEKQQWRLRFQRRSVLNTAEYSSLPTLCRQISRALRSITRIQENLLSTRALYSVIFFLADELNRTSSRTQAALLEAMEERQVTVEGNTFKLEKPFSVIATQNPTGASGTQLLPDSQIDRFTVRLSMGYPDNDAECKMLLNRSGKNPLTQ